MRLVIGDREFICVAPVQGSIDWWYDKGFKSPETGVIGTVEGSWEDKGKTYIEFTHGPVVAVSPIITPAIVRGERVRIYWIGKPTIERLGFDAAFTQP